MLRFLCAHHYYPDPARDIVLSHPQVHTSPFTYGSVSPHSPLALLWYDFLLTFPAEVRCIWKRKPTVASVAYLCIRYTLVIERVVSLLEILGNTTDDVQSYSVLHVSEN